MLHAGRSRTRRQQLGVKAVVGNAVSMGVLIYTGAGSLLLLAADYRRGVACPPSGHGNRRTAGRCSETWLHLALVLGGLSLSAPSVGRAVERADEAVFQMCAEGVTGITYLTKRQPEQLRFQLEVSGRKTAIRVSGFSDPDILTNASFYHGHLGHHVIVFSPARRKPGLVIAPETKQPSWGTNHLVRPPNDANLTLGESPLPRDAPVLPM